MNGTNVDPLAELVVSPLAIVLAMVVVNERLIEALTTRFLDGLFERKGWDKSWIMLLAWLSGTGLVLATQVNLFESYIPNWWIGWVLTGVLAGGGSNLLHDAFSALKPARASIGNLVEEYLANAPEASIASAYAKQLQSKPGPLTIVEPDADPESVSYTELAQSDLVGDDGEVKGRPD